MIKKIKKILSFVLRKFGISIIFDPYDYIQDITISYLHKYLEKKKSNIKNIVIVGGYLAHEVKKLKKNYHNCNFIIYEPSQRYFKDLEKKFLGDEKVIIKQKAISNISGSSKFYETNLKGSGSLFKVGELSKISYNAINQEAFDVQTTTLDKENFAFDCDCLWIDVQGAEKLVIEGAKFFLKKVNSIFIEVSVHDNLYKGGCTFVELDNFLRDNDFLIYLSGLDKENLTGNVLYVKKK